MDDASQRYFNGLRKEHFPPERNYLFAHLTMFHALPGDATEEIRNLLAGAVRGHGSIPAEVCGLRSLGSGIAFNIHAPELERVRREIATAFDGRLTGQDRQTWRPHITIQNKVNREVAAELFARLTNDFQPWTISVEGLDVWRYNGGPWDFASFFRFGYCTGPA